MGGLRLGAQWDDHLNGKVHARAGEFGGLRLGLNVVCEVSPHERGTCMLRLMRRVYCDGNSTVGRKDETCDQAGRGLHVHEVTVFVNPQWEGGMRHARLAGACVFIMSSL